MDTHFERISIFPTKSEKISNANRVSKKPKFICFSCNRFGSEKLCGFLFSFPIFNADGSCVLLLWIALLHIWLSVHQTPYSWMEWRPFDVSTKLKNASYTISLSWLQYIRSLLLSLHLPQLHIHEYPKCHTNGFVHREKLNEIKPNEFLSTYRCHSSNEMKWESEKEKEYSQL